MVTAEKHVLLQHSLRRGKELKMGLKWLGNDFNEQRPCYSLHLNIEKQSCDDE